MQQDGAPDAPPPHPAPAPVPPEFVRADLFDEAVAARAEQVAGVRAEQLAEARIEQLMPLRLDVALRERQQEQDRLDRRLRLIASLADKYDGDTKADGKQLHYWLEDMKVKFEGMNIYDDNERVVIASCLLKDAASRWWAHLDPKPTTWADFQAEARAQFQSALLTERLRLKLERLMQKTSASDYAEEFSRTAALLGEMSDADKISLFVRGLKAHVRLEVSLKKPATLKEAMDIASDVDEIMYAALHTGKGAPPAQGRGC